MFTIAVFFPCILLIQYFLISLFQSDQDVQDDEEDLAEDSFDELDEEVPDKSETPSKSRKAYTVAFKLEVVDYAKKNKSNYAAAKKYNLAPKRIRVWKEQEARLRRQKYVLKILL